MYNLNRCAIDNFVTTYGSDDLPEHKKCAVVDHFSCLSVISDFAKFLVLSARLKYN